MTAPKNRTRPPFDPELEALLGALGEQLPSTLTPEMIPVMREADVTAPIDEVLSGRKVTHREVTVPGYQGASLVASIFARHDHQAAGPGIFHTHGGGMIIGDRFTGIDVMLDWVERFDAVCVSLEYRLAPEFPDPFPVEDCYAGLVWTADNAAELGIDPDRLLIAGGSAGGGLAAGVALLARDRTGPKLFAQCLMYPMIDDRNETISSHQIDGEGVWDRNSNFTGWDALLGDRRGTEDVSIYAVPSRATDLSELPPTYIDVGTAEVFRDEDVAYASQIWADGGIAELHVWPGGFHGFDMMAPHTALAQAMMATRTAWLARILGV
ncbi:alpha/beta hydrolase [Brevibacterium aurantiacum]|uniref:Lipase n=1 Tax=Brevibacterium aurantiacum TaxID=273384 RepID=A0A2A3ZU35_BREAU|nr:alpha/beta hydrolase [Brevibacterium aurantiacum]MDN5546013.1 alpha/beta hydrolase [Rhodococcus sp. (in: high G+C Gram-positive bacteria)]PCC55099.1 lipase [Brevibacterium aurantiacum]